LISSLIRLISASSGMAVSSNFVLCRQIVPCLLVTLIVKDDFFSSILAKRGYEIMNLHTVLRRVCSVWLFSEMGLNMYLPMYWKKKSYY
jgi:uncharacterized membrane protein YjdF